MPSAVPPAQMPNPSPIPAPPAQRTRLVSLSAVQRRELALLRRDRNFLVQSLVLPLLIVGGQVAARHLGRRQHHVDESQRARLRGLRSRGAIRSACRHSRR